MLKLALEAPGIVLMSLWFTLNMSDMLFYYFWGFFADFAHVNARWNTLLECFHLNLSIPLYRVRSRSPVTCQMKLSVTTVNNSYQLLQFFIIKSSILDVFYFFLKPLFTKVISKVIFIQCRKRNNNFIQLIHQGGPVCIIEMAMQKIMCSGFGIDTTRTKRV